MFFYQVKNIFHGRKILYITLVYTFSIIIGGVFCDLFECPYVMVLSAILLLVVTAFKILVSRARNVTIFILIIAFCVGLMAYSSIRHFTEMRFSTLFNKKITLNGKIISYPKIKGDLSQYEIEITACFLKGANVNIVGRALMIVWRGKNNFKVGDLVEATGELTSGKGARNPGTFDARMNLVAKGMSGEIFVQDWDVKVIGSYFVNPLIEVGYSVKMAIVESIKGTLPEDKAALLNSMLIGYTEDVDDETKRDFNTAGLTHLLAVSGMNVSFVLLPILFIAKKLRVKRKRTGIIGLGTLVLFLFITGFAPSIVRACVMGGMVLIARMIDKDNDFATSIALAALVMEISNPMNVSDLGFQFSFCATIGIVLLSKSITGFFVNINIPKTISEVLSVTIAAQLAVMPIMINYFNQISVISIIANLLVVPLAGLITVLGFILAGVSKLQFLAGPISLLEGGLIGFVKLVTEYCANVPGAVLRIPDLGALGGVVYYFMLWLLFNYNKIYRNSVLSKTICGVIIICMLVVGNSFLSEKGLKITIFDVGQGDSILINTPQGKNVLIDTGDGKTNISSLLLGMGITKLDILILTHSHLDHIGGVDELKKWIVIGETFQPAFRSEKGLTDLKGERIQNGNFVSLEDGLKFKFLNPQPSDIESSDDNTANDSSIVVLLTYGKFDILLTGDIGNKIEEKLISNQLDKNIEVLKVAHHGSNESSSKNFLSYNAFQNGIISVGKNMYGHPNPMTIERLEMTGCKVYRTDMSGAVSVKTDGEGYSILTSLDEPPCGRLIYELSRAKETYRTR